MMETSILNQLPFDPGFLILGLIGLVSVSYTHLTLPTIA